jgi:hypothetical protein
VQFYSEEFRSYGLSPVAVFGFNRSRSRRRARDRSLNHASGCSFRSKKPTIPGQTPLLLRLDVCLFLFGITPSCPSWRIARWERFFSSLFDFKLCRVMLNRLTPFVRFSCAHAGNLERQDGLASTTFNVQRSTFNVQRSTFNVQRSTFGVRRSTFGVRRSAFGVWRLAFAVRIGR